MISIQYGVNQHKHHKEVEIQLALVIIATVHRGIISRHRMMNSMNILQIC
ncbi:unnamed protein product [Trichobilharzia regenti]|nr:unnamed protein product [Trichobilharzia regenti]